MEKPILFTNKELEALVVLCNCVNVSAEHAEEFGTARRKLIEEQLRRRSNGTRKEA